tara:strand:+ start:112 stop:624 length:513 start_codon:yes stop_codon:yes gene_type:complete
MAHFAEIRSSDNEVLRVVVISDEDVAANGGELSTQAETFVKNLLKTGDDTYWKQTSYNKAFRANLACIGGVYLPTEDVFHNAKPEGHPSYILDTTTYTWEPPLAVPETRPTVEAPLEAPEEWALLWDEDLWNSSGEKNGWKCQDGYGRFDDPTVGPVYYLDQETMEWVKK